MDALAIEESESASAAQAAVLDAIKSRLEMVIISPYCGIPGDFLQLVRTYSVLLNLAAIIHIQWNIDDGAQASELFQVRESGSFWKTGDFLLRGSKIGFLCIFLCASGEILLDSWGWSELTSYKLELNIIGILRI
jgi:hypothetical protein